VFDGCRGVLRHVFSSAFPHFAQHFLRAMPLPHFAYAAHYLLPHDAPTPV